MMGLQQSAVRLPVLALLWVLLLCSGVGSAASPVSAQGKAVAKVVGNPALPEPVPASVRVGTWNVRNYMAMDRRYDEAYRRDYPKPEAEKAALRQILLEVRPDILLLQEIGGAAYLRELQADLKREGLDYPYLFFPEKGSGLGATVQADAVNEDSSDKADAPYEDSSKADEPMPMQVRSAAVLSRYAWVQAQEAELSVTYFGKRQPLLRALVEVTYETPQGTPWSVFTLHLKSRYTNRKDDPESRTLRTAEATAIRNHIARIYPPQEGYRYLIGGDFNDLQDSAPLRRFLTRGKVTLSHIVRCYDERGELWTYFYAKQATYQLVDFFLVSPALRRHIGEGYIADKLPQSRIASDHRLVYVDVDLSF